MNHVEAIRLKSGGVRSLIELMKTTEHSNPGTRARVTELAETWMANYKNITLESSEEEVAGFNELDTNLMEAVIAYSKDDPRMAEMMDGEPSEEDLLTGAKEFIESAMNEAKMVLKMASVLQMAMIRIPGDLKEHEHKVFADMKTAIPEMIKIASDFIGFDPDTHDNPGLEIMKRANSFIEVNADFRDHVRKLKEVTTSRLGLPND